jgi:hypothetical protein
MAANRSPKERIAGNEIRHITQIVQIAQIGQFQMIAISFCMHVLFPVGKK